MSPNKPARSSKIFENRPRQSRRIGKGRLKEDGGLEDETRFVWDGSRLLQEVYARGRYTYVYTDQDSYEPLAQICEWEDEAGETRRQVNYFHCDQIGLPREMTDGEGRLLWFGNYGGWGKLTEETNIANAHQPFRLQNQYCDEETGLHYNFFRYYDPHSGRFVTQDPIGLWGGSNFYQFAANAQEWIDPLGLISSKVNFSRVVQYRRGTASVLKHILTRHRKSSKYSNVSRFNTDSVKKIQKIIEKGHNQQLGTCGSSKIATFDKNIGKGVDGKPTNKLQLFYDDKGFLSTAFPI